MGQAGEINIGQLARERHPGDARLIGFSTFEGTVTAASSWDGPAERKMVRPGLPRMGARRGPRDVSHGRVRPREVGDEHERTKAAEPVPGEPSKT
jgi:hypothetical protein